MANCSWRQQSLFCSTAFDELDQFSIGAEQELSPAAVQDAESHSWETRDQPAGRKAQGGMRWWQSHTFQIFKILQEDMWLLMTPNVHRGQKRQPWDKHPKELANHRDTNHHSWIWLLSSKYSMTIINKFATHPISPVLGNWALAQQMVCKDVMFMNTGLWNLGSLEDKTEP